MCSSDLLNPRNELVGPGGLKPGPTSSWGLGVQEARAPRARGACGFKRPGPHELVGASQSTISLQSTPKASHCTQKHPKAHQNTPKQQSKQASPTIRPRFKKYPEVFQSMPKHAETPTSSLKAPEASQSSLKHPKATQSSPKHRKTILLIIQYKEYTKTLLLIV